MRWTAPEALRHGRYSVKSDVWSYGVTMWEVFADMQLPYEGIPVSNLSLLSPHRTANNTPLATCLALSPRHSAKSPQTQHKYLPWLSPVACLKSHTRPLSDQSERFRMTRPLSCPFPTQGLRVPIEVYMGERLQKPESCPEVCVCACSMPAGKWSGSIDAGIKPCGHARVSPSAKMSESSCGDTVSP